MLIRAWKSTIFIFSACFLISPLASSQQNSQNWPAYGGGFDSIHYSTLSQINRGNVKNLQVAWTYDTGEKGGLQTTPIIVDGILYGITPSQRIFALNAATGKLIWKFESGPKGTQPARGLTWWSSGKEKRLYVGIMNFLYCLDATTGQPVKAFGEEGRVDLRKGLGRPYEEQSISLTSPGVIYKDVIIVGGRLPETLPAPPGDIRAFDIHTGALRWSFHTIPHPGEFGYDTWPKDQWQHSGAANNWPGMSVDVKRGIVFVPTGSAVFDFYGADRIGNDLFANTLLALDAATGKRIWHFQAVQHDIWDRDFPATPALVTVQRDGKSVDAVAQTSKQGWVFLFERETGKPLFPIEYHEYPASTIPGEVAAKTQPLPTRPAPYARQRLTEDMLTTRTPEMHDWALQQFRAAHSDGQFVPFALDKDTVIFPGFDGGAEWGGPAFDPESSLLYVNANEMAWMASLTETPLSEGGGIDTYATQCAVCHGESRKGSPPAFPSLENIGARLKPEEIRSTITHGKGRMPAFPGLRDNMLNDLVDFLLHPEAAQQKELTAKTAAPKEVPLAMKYHFKGYRRFLDPDGYPAIAPPWGTLNAINLNTGEYAWKINLGEYPALAAQGMKNTGSENYGGPVVTSGGLLFIGATIFDSKFRAFDKASGELLWETTLPFAAQSTPATYSVNGKQFVVIAAGGKDPRTPSGGAYVAFALPEK